MLEYERKPAEGAPALEPEKVKVIGIGGAGCNVLDRIALHERIDEGELLALNTDVRDLVSSVAQDTIQLGKKLTQGKLFLCDSGAQYFGGTTDVTRTVLI